MNENIVVMDLCILPTILESWLHLPPTLPTPSTDRSSELIMPGDKDVASLLSGFLWWKSSLQWTRSFCVSLIIHANICSVMIVCHQFYDSLTLSPIAETIAFQNTTIWRINPNSVNSQHHPSCKNMNDVTLKSTNHQMKTQNLTNKLRIITYPSTLQCAGSMPINNTNPWTTVQLVHYILTQTNLQLCGFLYASSWRMNPSQENSHRDCA